VIVEAMASGLPIVASDVSAIPELLGDTGVIVPRGDAPALAAALRDLADQPAHRQRLGARARARARVCYSADRQLGRIADVLRGARRTVVR
jgi:glycosyltransferase involved in cell wall biosynthesis